MNASLTQTRNKAVLPAWLGFTGLLTLVGVAAWIVQLRQGVGVTQLSNVTPWGIYIAGFIFFMGLSAGSLVLSALPVLFSLPKFRPYAQMAAFVALVSLIAGGLFILVDIGKPDRLWRIVRFAHLGSPMLWDLLLTIAYLFVSTVYLRRLMTAKSDAGLKPLAWIALLAGLADGLTGFVFATQVAHEFWFSAVQPVAFFVAALASAGAALLLVLLLLKPAGMVALDCCDLNPLSALTAGALSIDLLLIASELITLAFTRSAASLELVRGMLASPLFWVEIAAGGLAILLLLLPATRSKANWVIVASVLAIVDLALKRYLFVQTGFTIPNINYPGVVIAPAGPYLPSLLEWGVVVGLVGLFSLLLTLGIRNLRLIAPPVAKKSRR